MKVIGESCPQLCSLDIWNLNRLKDSAIAHLANGCRSIQKLKLGRNAFRCASEPYSLIWFCAYTDNRNYQGTLWRMLMRVEHFAATFGRNNSISFVSLNKFLSCLALIDCIASCLGE